MMTTTLRQQFTAAGAALVPDGDSLRIEAPAALPAALMERIRERREHMIETYTERAAIMEHDGGLSRADAEHEAAGAALDVLELPDGPALRNTCREWTEEDFELMELAQ